MSMATFSFSVAASIIDSTKVYHLQAVEVVSNPKESGAMRQQPSAVSQLSSQQLNDNNMVSVRGLSGVVPNFFMPDYGSRLTSAIYVRGVGSRLNSPAVGMYVDNIPYVDKSAFDFNFYNIERIDVLRGPQGTLYGRNAMGGIIKVHTHNPFRYKGTDVNMSYATGDNRSMFSVSHYHQPADNFSFSAGGYGEFSTGFFKNVTTGNKVDGGKSGGGRLRGIYIMSDDMKLDLHVGYDYTDQGAYPYFFTGSLNDPTLLADRKGTIHNNRESRYRRAMLNAGLNFEYQAPKFIMNAVTGYQNLNDRMFLDQDFTFMDIFSLEQKQRINTLNEEITFKSRPDKLWERVSGVNLMYQTLHTNGPVTFYRDGLDWLQSTINSHMPDLSTNPIIAGMGFKKMSVNFRGDAMAVGGDFDTPLFNAALFHQSTIHVTDKFDAIVGLRLDYEHIKLVYNSTSPVNYGFRFENTKIPVMNINLQHLSSTIMYNGKKKTDYWQLLPKIALRYSFDKNTNVYLSLAKGMRSGGYNVQMFSDLVQGAMQVEMMKGIKQGIFDYLDEKAASNPHMPVEMIKGLLDKNMPAAGNRPSVEQVQFKPEYSWTYEGGAHLSFPASRLFIDAALFYVDTRNQQIARFAGSSGFGRMMVNAGRGMSCGAELSVRWSPAEALALTANYGFTHAVFKEYDGGISGNVKNDYSDNYVPFVPKHTANIDAAYTLRFNRGMLQALTIGANYTGAGKIYWNESNTASQGYYSLLGARMTCATKYVDVSLWAKNIADTKYNTFYFESIGRSFEQHGKPFQLGIDLRMHF